MRTKTLLLTAATVVAGIVSASAQVYSVNIVGYVNKECPGTGKYILVSNPLDNGTNTLNDVFPNAPAFSQFQRWTGTTFESSTRGASSWTPNFSLPVGSGGFFRTPGNSTGFTNTFVGSMQSVVSFTNSWAGGYTIIGSKVPLAGDLNALGLTATLGSFDQVLTWDVVSQSYVTKTVSSPGAGTWSPAGAPILNVADGFFVRDLSTLNGPWVQNFTVQ